MKQRIVVDIQKLTIVGFALTILAACDNAQQASSTSAQAKPEVRIGRVICGGHLPLAIVEKKYQGDLKTFRLNAVQYHDWKIVVKDMRSGKLGGTFILSPLAMDLIRQGFPGKIVLMADRNGNGFVLSSKIKSIDELKNKKNIIAVPHIYSQHHVLLHRVLKQNKITEGKVTVIGMPPRDMINALRRGEIDGFVVGEPEGNKSISLGVGWMAAISPTIWKDHMDHVFLATDRFIQEHPDQLRELVTQLVRGGRFIEANPKLAAVMGEDYTGSSAAVFEKVLTDPPDWIDYSDMVPATTDLEAMAAHLVEMGLWKDVPKDLDGFTDVRFVKQATK